MQSSRGSNVDWADGFCIVIPSWNNLEYLKKCIGSISVYSQFPHQIVVHLNEARPNEESYLYSIGIKYTSSRTNIGVCGAVNKAARLCKKPLIMYANDDMFFLPGWDVELYAFQNKHKFDEKIWLSSTMIEPFGERPEMIAPYNYGKTCDDFQELRLLGGLERLRSKNPNINGTTWPPNVMHKSMFDKIGGFSEEFFPGFGSDPDLAKKMWDQGVRNFVGVGRSLVYHFQCVTTAKVSNMNNGHEIFKQQHGISMTHFVDNMLQRGKIWERS